MKKILKWVGIGFAALLVAVVTGAWAMFGTFVKATNSDSGVADYLISFLSHGFYKNDSKVETGSFGCSTIYTQDKNGTYYFGRNYDWAECQAMIIHTKPKNGYESVSTCCLDFLGFGDGYAPDGSMMERMRTAKAW